MICWLGRFLCKRAPDNRWFPFDFLVRYRCVEKKGIAPPCTPQFALQPSSVVVMEGGWHRNGNYSVLFWFRSVYSRFSMVPSCRTIDMKAWDSRTCYGIQLYREGGTFSGVAWTVQMDENPPNRIKRKRHRQKRKKVARVGRFRDPI